MGARNVTVTRIVEWTVCGLRSFHFECDCGKVGRGWVREASCVADAKRHAAEHAS